MVTTTPAPVPGGDVDDSTSMQTFEFGKEALNSISPVSPVVAVVGVDIESLPLQVWKLEAMDHHRLQTSSWSSSYRVFTHLVPESTGHLHHRNTSQQLGGRHDWALNCEDDRSYTNACTGKGYSYDSTGKIVVSGRYDSWCNDKCRCTKLSPKSCLDQLAIYVNCVFNGENITGFDGPVIRNIYTAEDVGNDTSVFR